jgi:hypothetical protein
LGFFDEGERIDEGIRFNLVSDSFNLIDMKPITGGDYSWI